MRASSCKPCHTWQFLQYLGQTYGLKPKTLANKRLKAQGPEYIKDGDRILYRQQAIKKYLEAKTVRTRP